MLAEDLGRAADGLFRLQGAVGPDFQRQLIIVGNLAYTGILNGVVHLLNGGEDTVHGDHTDRHVGVLVLVSADIATALIKGQLHLQMGILIQGGDVHIGIDDLDFIIHLDGASCYFAGTLGIDHHRLRTVGNHGYRQTLQVEDDLSHVLFHAGNSRELMLHTFNVHSRDRNAREGGQQHTAERVAQRVTKATLQGFHNELAIATVLANLYTLDACFFD